MWIFIILASIWCWIANMDVGERTIYRLWYSSKWMFLVRQPAAQHIESGCFTVPDQFSERCLRLFFHWNIVDTFAVCEEVLHFFVFIRFIFHRLCVLWCKKAFELADFTRRIWTNSSLGRCSSTAHILPIKSAYSNLLPNPSFRFPLPNWMLECNLFVRNYNERWNLVCP